MDEYDLLYDPLPDGLVEQDWLELPDIDRDWLEAPEIEHESPEHDLDDWGLER